MLKKYVKENFAIDIDHKYNDYLKYYVASEILEVAANSAWIIFTAQWFIIVSYLIIYITLNI